MIVSAGNYGYRTYAGIFLRSLLNNGGVLARDISYFIFDFSDNRAAYERNCYATMLYLLKAGRDIDFQLVGFKEMQEIIRKVRRFRTENVDLDIVDFLKCRVYSHLKKPYLWLDSDMVVRKPVRGLYKSCLKKKKLSMSSRSSDAVNLDYYFSYYSRYSKKELPERLKKKGTFNAGLIFIPKDYSKAWLDVYRAVASPDSGGVTGQGVWNTLFWLEGGSKVPEKYNFFYQGLTDKQAHILHFLHGHKDEMRKFA